MGKTPGALREKGLESRRFYDPRKEALQPYVRLAQFAKTQAQHIAASRFLVLRPAGLRAGAKAALREQPRLCRARADGDRKSTRLNSSHGYISYAVFCLKKKNLACLHARR